MEHVAATNARLARPDQAFEAWRARVERVRERDASDSERGGGIGVALQSKTAVVQRRARADPRGNASSES